jgi:ERCC4-type nuclease
MSTAFYDIFSAKKTKPKKEIQKQKIIIDYREKSSLVPSELIGLGFEVEFRELKVADYIVKETAIERKTVSDFISSMINKRLLNQLEELQQYKSKLLIIEGIDEQELYPENNGVNQNSVRGFLLSILLKHKIPVLFTQNYKDTAQFIERIARKKMIETGIRANKKTLSKKEQMQFILEGFPGIGPKTAKKLLKQFKTIKKVINASEEDLKKVLGKKSETVKKLVDENY